MEDKNGIMDHKKFKTKLTEKKREKNMLLLAQNQQGSCFNITPACPDLCYCTQGQYRRDYFIKEFNCVFVMVGICIVRIQLPRLVAL